MSIWASLGGPDILALDGHAEAANYRAEGTPEIEVDVATTGFHDHVRLALWSGEGLDVCALLSPEAARLLRDQLTAALEGRSGLDRREGAPRKAGVRARGGYTDELLREVAKVYEVNQGRPTKAVSEAFGVAHRTAGLYVRLARDAGFLGPYRQRVVGDLPSQAMRGEGRP